MNRRQLLVPCLAALTWYGPAASAAAGVDILGCAAQDKIAISPSDTLDCEWKHGAFNATLTQLYSEGWRLKIATFYEHDREVLYLERADTPTADPAPASSPSPSPKP